MTLLPYAFGSFIRLGMAVGSLTSVVAAATDLTVLVENVKSGEGTVRAGLFNKVGAFPKTPLIRQSAEAKTDAVSIVFKDLEPGSYAISAFHDVNDNQKLDTNFVGMPIEPYGFSRDAHGLFGPPAFDDARLAVDGKDKLVSIHLK
jgi:uncharacterized protein (DUF2141 family)